MWTAPTLPGESLSLGTDRFEKKNYNAGRGTKIIAMPLSVSGDVIRGRNTDFE